MAELLQTGHPIRNRELIFERPDGSRLTILANLDPLRDETGKLVGGVNCFQDITARKAAEQRLQQRERWYRDLLEALPAAIYTTDADGRITFCNEAAAELCGRHPVVGNDAWSIAGKLYWPDGKPIAHEECPTALAVKTGKPVRGTEKIVERPDGTRVPILPFPTPLHDAEGRLIGAVNMLVDITERKAAEEEKALLLRELAHRVNNTFAVILAVAQQTLRTAPSAEAFVETFTGRLQALAQAHNLLLAKDWTGADLGELAKGQLAPFCLEGQDRLTIEGPKVTLSPPQAIALGVVLHELGTNAARYGALSNGTGRVDLSWTLGSGWSISPGLSAMGRRSCRLSARGLAPSSSSAACPTRRSTGVSRPTAWCARSTFLLPSRGQGTAKKRGTKLRWLSWDLTVLLRRERLARV
jgi:PAS domain S-box-containing protein